MDLHVAHERGGGPADELPVHEGARLARGDVGEGIYNVMYVVFVRAVLHGGALAFGWLSSAQAAGGLLGGFVIGHAGRRLTPRSLIALLAAVGLSTLVLIRFPTVLVALGVALFAGIPAVGYTVGFTTRLQDATDDRYRGRIFGAYGTTWALLTLVGQVTGSGLGDRLGISALLAVEGVLNIAAGVLALVSTPGKVMAWVRTWICGHSLVKFCFTRLNRQYGHSTFAVFRRD